VGGGVGLDAAGYLDHGCGRCFDAFEASRSDRRQDGRAEGRGVRHLGQGQRDTRNIGVDLHPQLGAGRAAAEDDLIRNVVAVAHGLKHRFGAEGHALQDGAKKMAAPVLEAKTHDGAPGSYNCPLATYGTTR
jgi:hypothetical protein